jgi:hypothetical protein
MNGAAAQRGGAGGREILFGHAIASEFHRGKINRRHGLPNLNNSKNRNPMKERITFTAVVAGLCLAVLIAMTAAGCSPASNDPLATKVTLTKPYPLHYTGDESDRISVQFAACELANQARLGYDFNASKTNAGDACRKFITPEIKGVPLREALEQILQPEGLSYDIHDGRLTLKKN